MEKHIYSQPLRLNGLKNHYSEMNTLLGRDSEITYNDILSGIYFVDICIYEYSIDWTHNPRCEGI